MTRNPRRILAAAGFAALACLSVASAQAPQAAAGTGAAASPIPADPWPRVVDLTTGQVLVYQPQVNKWDDNQLDFRAAMAFKKDNSNEQTFGVVFATTRTQVDKVARTVVFENLAISKIDFPTLPDRGASFGPELTKEFAAKIRTMSLDRLQASLAAAGIKPPAVEVNNAPPQVIVSYSPAILVPIDGAPVLKPVAEHAAVPARDQHARADPAGRPRAELLHPRVRRLAHLQRDHGPLDAVVPGSRSAWTTSRRSSRRATRSTCSTAARRPIRSRRSPTACRRSTRARCPPNSSCSGPGRLRADRGHAAAVGVEHDQRRADRHREQQLLRAARRALVPLGRDHRAVDIRPAAMRCRPTSREFRRHRSPAPCCRRSRERRRRRRRSSRTRSRRRPRCRARAARRSRRASTDRRSTCRSRTRR